MKYIHTYIHTYIWLDSFLSVFNMFFKHNMRLVLYWTKVSMRYVSALYRAYSLKIEHGEYAWLIS